VLHRKLYGTIASIFEKFVPLFNKVLTDRLNPRPLRVEVDPSGWYKDQSPNYDDDDKYLEWQENRQPVLPEPPDVFSPPPPPSKLVDLCGRKLQVIVKLANIELTPEKPSYPGGVWHVEGMRNESIVASGIYYYASKNLTQSKLAFRQAVREPDYEQNDDKGVRTVYGLTNEGPLNQPLGAIVTQEDRCIAFPNIFQHKVEPFQLVDRTQPGHRKILVFFLVDPCREIISTLTVPPQQRTWLVDKLKDVPPLSGLPLEVVKRIVSFLDWPMSLSEAKEYRAELMAERKYFISKNNEEYFEREFSLCEH